jgi:hypothetical protein
MLSARVHIPKPDFRSGNLAGNKNMRKSSIELDFIRRREMNDELARQDEPDSIRSRGISLNAFSPNASTAKVCP